MLTAAEERKRLRRAAVHEASHAVVAHALGYPISAASVVPGPGHSGRVSLLSAAEGWPAAAEWERRQDLAAIAAAGEVGEQLLLGAAAADAAGSDWAIVSDMAAGEYGDLGELQALAKRRAAAVLTARKAALDALIEALLTYKSLSGARVAVLLGVGESC